MYPIISQIERTALEIRLREVLGAGVATTAFLKIVDAVNFTGYPDSEVTPEVTPEVAPEVQVIESSP